MKLKLQRNFVYVLADIENEVEGFLFNYAEFGSNLLPFLQDHNLVPDDDDYDHCHKSGGKIFRERRKNR